MIGVLIWLLFQNEFLKKHFEIIYSCTGNIRFMNITFCLGTVKSTSRQISMPYRFSYYKSSEGGTPLFKVYFNKRLFSAYRDVLACTFQTYLFDAN